jgi:hypothetical protein
LSVSRIRKPQRAQRGVIVKKLIFAAIVLFLAFGPIMASDLEIFIQNRPLQGAPVLQGDEIYVPASELQKLLKGAFTWNDRGEIQVQGETLSAKTLTTPGGLMVPLKSLSKALGYKISINSATGIVDVYKERAADPVKTAPVSTVSATPSASPRPSPGQPEVKKDLLTIRETSFSPDTGVADKEGVTRGYRVFCDVVNGRSSPARNVSAQCVLKRADEQVIASKIESLGTLAPGERKEVIFYIPSYEPTIVNTNLIKRELTVKGE